MSTCEFSTEPHACMVLHAGPIQERSALSRLQAEEDLAMGEVLTRMSGYLVVAFLNLFVTSSAFPGELLSLLAVKVALKSCTREGTRMVLAHVKSYHHLSQGYEKV